MAWCKSSLLSGIGKSYPFALVWLAAHFLCDKVKARLLLLLQQLHDLLKSIYKYVFLIVQSSVYPMANYTPLF